jgi:apolipoprotein D and lipocalin family protein
MKFSLTALLPVLSLFTACTSSPTKPISVSQVDLTRFMGSWYVIANIPTFAEKEAFGGVESYALNPDGSIATTFTFHKGGFDGPLKTMKPTGFVRDSSNATWGMQFVWPFKAEYLIAYVDPQYSETIIARNKRDYVWIMARKPELAPEDYQRLVDRVGQLGYDLSKLKKVPQTVAKSSTP